MTFEVDLKRPLGLILREIAGYGVYVDAVTPEGSANAAAVQVFFIAPRKDLDDTREAPNLLKRDQQLTPWRTARRAHVFLPCPPVTSSS